jgi:hypothetical protein
VSGCAEFPVIHYLLILQDVISNESLSLGPSALPQFFTNSSHIRENAQYSYVVEAVNTIGISSAIEAREFCESLN